MRFGWLVVVLGLGACAGDDEEEHESGPICSELGEICHEAGESGDAEAEACHELGHGGEEADCEAELERCTTLCDELAAAGT